MVVESVFPPPRPSPSFAAHPQHANMAWELAPLVASPSTNKGEFWKVRPTRFQTTQHLATVVLFSKNSLDAGESSQDVSQGTDINRSAVAEGTGGAMEQGEGQESKIKPSETSKRNVQQLLTEADIASTTSCSCAPLIWKERYLVVALVTGEIRVYSNLLASCQHDPILTAQHQDSSMAPTAKPVSSIHVPLATLSLQSDAIIVQLLSLADTDTIIALSVEGHVHVMTWLPDNTLEMQITWMTGDFGATCMTAVTELSRQSLLVIGYNSGLIDCWKLPVDAVNSLPAAASPLKARRVLRKRPECVWRGRVQDLYAVRSLATMQATDAHNVDLCSAHDEAVVDVILSCDTTGSMDASENSPQVQQQGLTTTDQEPVSASPEVRRNPLLLIAVIQPALGDDPPIVHAFDLDGISGKRRKESRTTAFRIRDESSSCRPTDVISLSSFRVAPDPTMGIMETERQTIVLETEGSTNENFDGITSTPLSFRIPNVAIPQACRAMSLPGSPGVAVTLSSGTVAQLWPGWGIRRDDDQLLLPHPVVGLGLFVYDARPHWVCGLRGGTCYLIPVANDRDDGELPPIRVALYPHDIDVDNTSIYMQDMTAGNLQKLEGDDDFKVPVLVYVMPGGVVEIYSCELAVTRRSDPDLAVPPDSEEDQYLEAAIKHGCLELVVRLLHERQDTAWVAGVDDEGNDSLLWEAAYQEIMAPLAATTANGEGRNEHADAATITVGPFSRNPTTMDDLRQMPALQSLLLSLARTDT